MTNKHFRSLSILLVSLSFSLILIFTAAATKASATVTWTATTEANKYVGQINIPAGEFTTKSGTWWANAVVVDGTLFVDSWSSSNQDKGNITIHANNITIGPNGKIDATGAGYFGGTGDSSAVSGGDGGNGGKGGRGSNENNDIQEKGRGEIGDPGTAGNSGGGQDLGFGFFLGGFEGDAGQHGSRPSSGSWDNDHNARGGGGGGAGGPGEDGWGGVYSYYDTSDGGLDPRDNDTNYTDKTVGEEIGMGYGGGGGGSGGSGGGGCGGAGSWFYWNDTARDGGKGGKGGAGEVGADGGRGGGCIKLYAKDAFILKGALSTQGLPGSNAQTWDSPGRDGSDGEGGNKGNGGNGGSAANDAGNGGRPSTAYYDSAGGGGGGAGGLGGDGGGGAGGGVLIYCDRYDGISIDTDARINTRGGEHWGTTYLDGHRTGNGGTLKIFYSGTEPTVTKSDGGRNLQGRYFPFEVPAWDAPTSPSCESPANDGTTPISIPKVLSWECSSPLSHPLKYDVWFGKSTDNPTRILQDTSNKYADISGRSLDNSTVYRWRVAAQDQITLAVTVSEDFLFLTEGNTGTIKVKTYKRINSNNQKMSACPISFTITGPRTFSSATDASGNWALITMLGEYSITFEAKYGATPPLQTLTLGIGQTISFVATYEISDTNPPSRPILHVPQANESSSVPLSWEAAIDDQTEVTGYKLNISGQEIPLGNVTQYPKTGMADGKYQAFVIAYDLADNPAASEIVSFEVNSKKPDITISSDKNKYGPGGFPPTISATRRSPLVIEASDGNSISSLEVILKDGDGYENKNVSGSMDKITLNIDDLKEGDYSLVVAASDKGVFPRTNTGTFAIKIYSGNADIVGKPYNYPNPFNLETKPANAISSQTRTIISFTLAGDSATKIMIYDSAGKPVKTFGCSKGSNGGKIGENLLEWDGKDNFGKYVANGPYYYYIIVNGKVIGKGEMAAFR